VYLLDTNIVSLLDPRRREGAGGIPAWIRRNGAHLSLSAVTLMELEAGVLKLRREGKHKRADEYEGLRQKITDDFGERVMSFDAAVALAAARLAEAARPAVIEWKDLVIAATAKVHGLTILTRNLRHFAVTGVPTLDPLSELPADAGG
jgi:predicted nucleic acid-binding protein